MTDPSILEQQALKAAGFASAAENMNAEKEMVKEVKEVKEIKEVKGKEEPVKEEEKREYTPEEKMKIVAEVIRGRFGNVPNLPTEEQLKNLKRTHGSIFFLDLGGQDIFLYRYIKRVEHMSMISSSGWDNLSEDQREEKIVDKCLIWPFITEEQKMIIPAGKIKLLSDQILLNSMFLDPAQVATLTIKL